jgi:hypothetical protein
MMSPGALKSNGKYPYFECGGVSYRFAAITIRKLNQPINGTLVFQDESLISVLIFI